MEAFDLVAELRDDSGRGASRRLRKDGKLPGILYGGGQEATPITLNHDDVFHHLEQEAFYSHILNLTIGKKKQKVVLKDLQRHPYKPTITHIDLQRVSETEKLTMRVPIHFLNEEKCIGVKQSGGIVSHIMTELEVTCLPKDLPEYIEVDVLNLDVGDSIHVEELQLPEGVVSYAMEHGGDGSAPVVAVNMPRVVIEEEEEAEAEAEAAEEEAAAAAAEMPEAEEGTEEDKDKDKDKDREEKSKD